MAVLILAYVFFLLLVAPISIWLLLNAKTAVGTYLALAGICFSILPAVFGLWKWDYERQPVWIIISIGLSLAVVVCLAFIFANIPTGQPSTLRVSHQFTKATKFNRYALTNIVPEIEQIQLGFLIMPYLDRILTREQGKRASAFTLDLYEEMEKDPDFRELGSAMGWAYAELVGQPFNVGHYYLYVPKQYSEKPTPVVIFLHGSAGNFKTYTWFWSKVADRLGCVVVLPSFGFGNWRREEGLQTVLDVLADVEQKVNIDKDEVYLAGLSNGGIGVTRVAAYAPQRFKGVILISPVMDTEIINHPSFSEEWKDRPVLIITGEEDRRTPIEYVSRRVAILTAGGVNADFIHYQNEDHFLVFSRPDEVIEDISDWLVKVSNKL